MCDKLLNCNTTNATSNPIKLDKTAPVFTGKTTYAGWYTTTQTSTFYYTDTVS